MLISDLCTPAFVYMAFALSSVASDLIAGVYGAATSKAVVGIIITLLLSALCKRGFGTLAWLIVLIPFALMTLIVMMLLAGGVLGGDMHEVDSGVVVMDD